MVKYLISGTISLANILVRNQDWKIKFKILCVCMWHSRLFRLNWEQHWPRLLQQVLGTSALGHKQMMSSTRVRDYFDNLADSIEKNSKGVQVKTQITSSTEFLQLFFAVWSLRTRFRRSVSSVQESATSKCPTFLFVKTL